MNFFWVMLASVAIGGLAQAWVKAQYRRFSAVPLASGLTGAQAARRVLDMNGLTGVSIEMIGGQLTDHFDPAAGVLRLSQGVYQGRSVASAGVAAHEAGHAVQHAKGFVAARARIALVPVANIGSQAAPFLVIGGLFLGLLQLAWVGIALYAAAVLFQLVTLPVELDASRRALESLEPAGIVDADELPGARSVLKAAALTYVAAALVSIVYLLYFVGMARRR
jgi:Zn-dependent membrane protease YugP